MARTPEDPEKYPLVCKECGKGAGVYRVGEVTQEVTASLRGWLDPEDPAKRRPVLTSADVDDLMSDGDVQWEGWACSECHAEWGNHALASVSDGVHHRDERKANPCTCGHDRCEHSERHKPAYRMTLPDLACDTEGCGCMDFVDARPPVVQPRPGQLGFDGTMVPFQESMAS